MRKTTNVLSIALFLALAGLGFAQTHSVPDHLGMISRPAHADPMVLTAKETLRATYSDSGSTGGFNSSCSFAGCISPPSTIYSYNITCPVLVGKTCTYDIQIAGQVMSGGNSDAVGENGLYQFLIDGAPPTGGGTDINGNYSWQYGGPEFEFGTSYSVHSKVTNDVANQAHTISVSVLCEEVNGDLNGCWVFSGFQTMVVRVWTP
jgi:hypothetical protein